MTFCSLALVNYFPRAPYPGFSNARLGVSIGFGQSYPRSISFAIIIVLSLVCASNASLADVPSSDWPMYMRTPDNLGLRYGIGTFTDPQIQWEVNLVDYHPGSEHYLFDHIPTDLDDDGILDILTTASFRYSDHPDTGSQFLMGLDGMDGSILWEREFGESRSGIDTPVVGDVDGDGQREIIIGSGKWLRCLSSSDGEEEWSLELDTIWLDVVEPILLWNQTNLRYDIIYANPVGNVSKIDGETGLVKQKIVLRDFLDPELGIESPLLSFLSNDTGVSNILVTMRYPYSGSMCVLNPDLGVEWWEEFETYYPTGVPAIDDEDPGDMRIAFNSWEYYHDEDHFVVIEASDGRNLWDVELDFLGIANRGNRIVVDDIDADGEAEYVLLNSPKGNMYVFDRNGTVQWERGVSCRDVGAIDDIDSDGIDEIVIVSGSGEVISLSGPSGDLKWSTFVHDNLDSSLLVCDIDGDLKKEMVVGSYNGMLFSLKGNADENFAPILSVESPSNGSHFHGSVNISGSVIDADNGSGDITIELRIDDGDWHRIASGSSFDHELELPETDANEYILQLRANDGTSDSNIVNRTVIPEVDRSPSNINILLIFLSCALILVILILFIIRKRE